MLVLGSCILLQSTTPTSSTSIQPTTPRPPLAAVSRTCRRVRHSNTRRRLETTRGTSSSKLSPTLTIYYTTFLSTSTLTNNTTPASCSRTISLTPTPFDVGPQVRFRCMLILSKLTNCLMECLSLTPHVCSIDSYQLQVSYIPSSE
jgi:hypothetical protein